MKTITIQVQGPDDWCVSDIVEAVDRRAFTPVSDEPVAWRYHVVSPFKDKDGMCNVSDRWTLIDSPGQRDAHSACCGMLAEPLYAAPQLKSLSDEEIEPIVDVFYKHWRNHNAFNFGEIRADIRAALKGKS
jgi:hypothetical protein